MVEHLVHLARPTLAEKAGDRRVADVGADAAVANISAARHGRSADVLAERRRRAVEHRRRVVRRDVSHRASGAVRRDRHVRIVQFGEHLRHDHRERRVGRRGQRLGSVARADRGPVDPLQLEERVVKVELAPHLVEDRRVVGRRRSDQAGSPSIRRRRRRAPRLPMPSFSWLPPAESRDDAERDRVGDRAIRLLIGQVERAQAIRGEQPEALRCDDSYEIPALIARNELGVANSTARRWPFPPRVRIGSMHEAHQRSAEVDARHAAGERSAPRDFGADRRHAMHVVGDGRTGIGVVMSRESTADVGEETDAEALRSCDAPSSRTALNARRPSNEFSVAGVPAVRLVVELRRAPSKVVANVHRPNPRRYPRPTSYPRPENASGDALRSRC